MCSCYSRMLCSIYLYLAARDTATSIVSQLRVKLGVLEMPGWAACSLKLPIESIE